MPPRTKRVCVYINVSAGHAIIHVHTSLALEMPSSMYKNGCTRNWKLAHKNYHVLSWRSTMSDGAERLRSSADPVETLVQRPFAAHPPVPLRTADAGSAITASDEEKDKEKNENNITKGDISQKI